MGYTGPERRIHRVFVTHNTEYHVRRNTCVAIRDRESGQWKVQHLALQQTISGTISFQPNGSLKVSPGLPRVGESMLFEVGQQDLVTSTVVSVERPSHDVVSGYVS